MFEPEGGRKTEAAAPQLTLMLMIIVMDCDRADELSDFLKEQFVRIQYACSGRGTANSEVLDYLGLDGAEKEIFFCVMPDFQAGWLMKKMPGWLESRKNVHGIAFTTPMSGIIRPALNIFNADFIKKVSENLQGLFNEGMKNMPETENHADDELKHDLVIAIATQGYSKDIIEAAKAAGAKGGTVINARRAGFEDNATFLGKPIQSAKEIIMILIERKQKLAVMKAINHDFGHSSDARGLVFSLPVDSVAGLRTPAI